MIKKAYNSTYPKVAVQWLNQALYLYQSLCLVDNEVLQNRHLRVAANCWLQFIKTMKLHYLTFILTLLCSCDSKDDLDSFKSIDTKKYNVLIKDGIERNEFWVKDLVTISHKLFTNENYPRTLKIELDNSDQTYVTVTHTLEGPYDDAAEGKTRTATAGRTTRSCAARTA